MGKMIPETKTGKMSHNFSPLCFAV